MTLDWMSEANCLDVDPAIFFPAAKKGGANLTTYGKAREVCRDCPVAGECLDYALSVVDDGPGWRQGMFGGLNPSERDRVARGTRWCLRCGCKFSGHRDRYCAECGPVARAESQARSNANRKVNA